MEVKREIAVYQKKGDKFIESFKIDISANILINILKVDAEDDPNVYLLYTIDKEQYSEFQKLIPTLKNIDFNDVELFYECFQVS